MRMGRCDWRYTHREHRHEQAQAPPGPLFPRSNSVFFNHIYYSHNVDVKAQWGGGLGGDTRRRRGRRAEEHKPRGGGGGAGGMPQDLVCALLLVPVTESCLRM